MIKGQSSNMSSFVSITLNFDTSLLVNLLSNSETSLFPNPLFTEHGLSSEIHLFLYR